MARALNLSVSGSKRVLFNKIQDCQNEDVRKLDNERFEVRRQEATGSAQSVPKRVIFSPQQVKDIPGMNEATGAQHGAFGQTNKENEIGPEKHEYLTHPSKKTEACICEEA